MSLMQLLANGKTLVDLKRPTGRYHMPGKNFLPKFGAAKNPFQAAEKNPSVPANVAPFAERGPRPYMRPAKVPVKIPAANLKATQRMPVLAEKLKETKRLPFVAARNSAQAPVQAAESAWWEKFLDWAGEVMSKMAGWWSARKPARKPAVSRFDKPVVQGELSLENIKVVRNDLSDADMEVVAAKTFTGETNFKPALQAQAGGELAMSHSQPA